MMKWALNEKTGNIQNLWVNYNSLGIAIQYGVCRVSTTWELMKNAESQALPQESESAF